jgi:hypothetical protein
MRPINLLVACAAVLVMLSLSGCWVPPDHGPYTYDRGDRVDRDGNRDVGWCVEHPGNVHCSESR